VTGAITEKLEPRELGSRLPVMIRNSTVPSPETSSVVAPASRSVPSPRCWVYHGMRLLGLRTMKTAEDPSPVQP
jgi:hypothetical protein